MSDNCFFIKQFIVRTISSDNGTKYDQRGKYLRRSEWNDAGV